MNVRRRAQIAAMLFASISCAGKRDDADSTKPLEVTPVVAKRDFVLSGTDGKPVSFRSATAGHLTFLFFGYTHCPDVCPVQMANLTGAMHRLLPEEADSIRVVFVTTDPDRDTPEVIRKWLDSFDPALIGLRGSADSVNAIQKSFGLAPAIAERADSNGRYGVGHAAQILVFTADDSLRYEFPFGTRQSDWAAELPRLLSWRGK